MATFVKSESFTCIPFSNQGVSIRPLKSNKAGFSLLYFFIYLLFKFLAALVPCCCARAFSSCSERGLLFAVVRGLLIVVASLAAEHGL